MADECGRLTVTQIGGIAGDATLPPLVDVDRKLLDQAGRRALDDACGQLVSAAANRDAAAVIGADMAQYRVDLTDMNGDKRNFMLPGPGNTAGVAGNVDVPELLAPLLQLQSAGVARGS